MVGGSLPPTASTSEQTGVSVGAGDCPTPALLT